jgi:Tfp pilus assembly protein PilN
MPGVIEQLELRKLVAFGTGAGIEIRGGDLEVALVRVRPRGIRVLGRLTIRDFRGRPAAEWGAEYTAFLKAHGASHLGATVLLPRQDVIVRQVSLPGVIGEDLEAAIALQLDTLHPYGEDDVQYSWIPVGKGSALIGMLRRSAMEQIASLLDEAGIAVACLTFSAAAVYGAIRLLRDPHLNGFVAVNDAASAIEIYGESPDRPVFSAEFDLPLERVVALSVSELRLDPETQPVRLMEVLPAPKVNPIENDFSRDALPYAAALAGACPRLAPAANLLPPERRAGRSRAMFIPTAVLAALLLIAAGALLLQSRLEQRQYLRRLQADISRLEPRAARAQALDRQTDLARARSLLLDDFRNRSRADLDSLNELTKLLNPPIWTSQFDLNRDSVTIMGEADQAAGLLSVINSSPLFLNAEFSMISKSPAGELFRIRTARRMKR